METKQELRDQNKQLKSELNRLKLENEMKIQQIQTDILQMKAKEIEDRKEKEYKDWVQRNFKFIKRFIEENVRAELYDGPYECDNHQYVSIDVYTPQQIEEKRTNN